MMMKEPIDTQSHWFRTDGSFGRRQRVIRDRHRAGDSIEEIAKDYGAPVEAIRKIVEGRGSGREE